MHSDDALINDFPRLVLADMVGFPFEIARVMRLSYASNRVTTTLMGNIGGYGQV
jgi:hypothetical protein